MRSQIKRAQTINRSRRVQRSEAAAQEGAYAGNSATEGYLRTMAVSGPGDTAEVEARQNADRVMSQLDGGDVHRDSGGSGSGFEAPADVSAGIDTASRGPSGSLPQGLSGQMGAAMGTSFDHVRVHNDAASHALSESLSANAFTMGQDVFFGAGQYQPDTSGGQQLIAHELTHVAQDSGMVFRSPNQSQNQNQNTPPPAAAAPPKETEEQRKKREEEEEAKKRKTESANKLPDMSPEATTLAKTLADSPLLRRVVLIMLRIKRTGTTFTAGDLDKGVDWKDAADLAGNTLGLLGGASDAAGVGMDSADLDYGGNITDMASGALGIGSNAAGLATTVGGAIESRKQDKDALDALGEEGKGLKAGKDYDSSSDTLSDTLKTSGSILGLIGSTKGIIGGGLGAGSTYHEKKGDLERGDKLDTASGIVGTLGSSLGTLGTGLGAAADVMDYRSTFGGETNKKFDELKKQFPKPGEKDRVSTLDADAEPELADKFLSYAIHNKVGNAQLTDFAFVVKTWKQGKDDAEISAIKRKAAKAIPLMQSHHAKLKGRRGAGLDALLSATDTFGGVLGSIGTGLTSFLDHGTGGNTAGLVLRGLASIISFGTNAIGMARKSKKINDSKSDKRQSKYLDRVNGLIDSFKTLPDMKFDSLDVAFFGTKGMSADGQAAATTDGNEDVASLEDYVNMVGSMKEEFKMLHLAASADPLSKDALSDEERKRMANALADGMGK